MRIIAVRIDPGGAPVVVECPAGAYRYLADTFFPDGFDGIQLGAGVIGYVGDSSLIDGSPPNPAALAIANVVYQRHAGRFYHTDVRGPMVILGVTDSGESASVPAAFVREFLPQLECEMAVSAQDGER